MHTFSDFFPLCFHWASLVAQMQRICLKCGRPGFDPWAGMTPWRRAWQPTPVFLARESPWTEEPGGLQSMGTQTVRHDWVTQHSTYIYFFRFFSIVGYYKILNIILCPTQYVPVVYLFYVYWCVSDNPQFHIYPSLPGLVSLKWKWKLLSLVQLFATPWCIPRPEYWSR